MKKLFLILFLSLAWGGNVFAKEIKWKLPIFIEGKMVVKKQTIKNYQAFDHGNNPNSKCLGSLAGFSFINNYKKKDINLTNVNSVSLVFLVRTKRTITYVCYP